MLLTSSNPAIFYMATDISQTFGLTLLELMEIMTVVAGIGSSCVAVVVLFVHLRQHKIQIRATSADLALKMLEYWSESRYPDFAEFIERLHASKVAEDDPKIPLFLGALEEVAIFWKEGTITDNHVKEFFGPDLRGILKNDPVHNYLKERHKGSTYANLWELLGKSRGWAD